jgi:NAD(P)-dependent dehydrogenase (short-subunit alcohol dehydrogenase family)
MPDTRVALVTGANQDIGRHVAQELAANGLTVLVGSRNVERGAAAVTEIGSGAIPIQLDVTDPRSIAPAAEHTGRAEVTESPPAGRGVRF